MKSYFERAMKNARVRDILPKAICLMLGVILWAYISSSNTSEIEYKISLTYKNLSSNLIVSRVSHKNVKVICEGKKEYLNNVRPKNLKVIVDLKKARVGKARSYKVELIKTGVPEGVDISLKNKRVRLSVERKARKKIKIILRTRGDVKKGCFVGKVKVKPSWVSVTGPKSVIDKIEDVDTETISLAGKSETIKREFDLNIKNIRDVSFSTTTVSVVIPIIEFGDLYTLDVPVKLKNIDSNYRYILRDSSIKLYIKKTTASKISVNDVDVTIDIKKIKIKKLFSRKKQDFIDTEIPVNIVIKNNVDASIVSVLPERVILRIKKQ
ncbi:YbbR-like domain-containing protein [Spirochaetota bacterium]